MPDWETHREVFVPPPMSGEMIDRIYYLLIGGMAVAFVCGAACWWAFERLFNFC